MKAPVGADRRSLSLRPGGRSGAPARDLLLESRPRKWPRMDARESLIAVLQLAYSGERAAGYAYRGHWNSLSDPDERARVRQIEDEEWHHRQLVGGMLARLGAAPSRARELRALVIGRTLGLLCHVSGWLLPMYGAGRLERKNVGEYESAARDARLSGNEDLVDCLLTMAEVEWDHEAYFRERVERSALGRRFLWRPLPPRSAIRGAFAALLLAVLALGAPATAPRRGGLRARSRLAGAARRAEGRAHQAQLDEPHLPGHRARLLGLRADAVRQGEARRGDGLPGRRRLREGRRQLARAGRVRQPDPQGRDAGDDRHLHQPGRGSGRERERAAALQPQLRVRRAERPLRALPARGDPARGGQEA